MKLPIHILLWSLSIGIGTQVNAQFTIPVTWTGGSGPAGGPSTEVCGLNVITFTADTIPAGLTYRWVTIPYSSNCPVGSSVVLSTGTPVLNFGQTEMIKCQAVDSLNQVQGESWDIAVINPDFNGGICADGSLGPVSICAGDSVRLSFIEANEWIFTIGINPPGAVQWQLNGVDIPGAISDQFYATQTGVYRTKFTLGCGTGYSNDIQINYNQLLTPITGSNVICSGSNTTLCAPPGYTCYLWSEGSNTQCITVNTAGSYTVTVCDSTGCMLTETVVVTVNPNPVPVITGPSSVCVGSSAQLCLTGSFVCYIWANGSTAPCVFVTTPGIYWVTVCDANGCTGTDSVVVSVAPAPIVGITATDSSVCLNESVILDAFGGPFSSYLWSNGALTQTITVIGPGTYTVIVTDSNGCTGTSSITLFAEPAYPTILSASGPIEFCLGDSVKLTAPSPMLSWQWYRSNVLIPGATSSSIWVKSNGRYHCETLDLNGACAGLSNALRVRIVCFPPPPPINRISGITYTISAIPNPASEIINLQLQGSGSDQVPEFFIYDLSGKLILKGKLTEEDNYLDISFLTKGIYVIRVLEDQEVQSIKLVKY